MYHSLIFWDGEISFYTSAQANALRDPDLAGVIKGIHTWHDWHIIPASKPSIELPAFDINENEVYGRSGTVDVTDKVYDGEIIYRDRSGSINFYIDHEQVDWRTLRKKIVQALEGKTIKMVLEDDPGYYYQGRFHLGSISPEASYSQLTITYQLEPYRYPLISGSKWGNVYWDPFNFETDYDFTVDPSKATEISQEGVL